MSGANRPCPGCWQCWPRIDHDIVAHARAGVAGGLPLSELAVIVIATAEGYVIGAIPLVEEERRIRQPLARAPAGAVVVVLIVEDDAFEVSHVRVDGLGDEARA